MAGGKGMLSGTVAGLLATLVIGGTLSTLMPLQNEGPATTAAAPPQPAAPAASPETALPSDKTAAAGDGAPLPVEAAATPALLSASADPASTGGEVAPKSPPVASLQAAISPPQAQDAAPPSPAAHAPAPAVPETVAEALPDQAATPDSALPNPLDPGPLLDNAPALQPLSPARVAEALAPILQGSRLTAFQSAPSASLPPLPDAALALDPARASLPNLDPNAPTLLQHSAPLPDGQPSLIPNTPVSGGEDPGLLTLPLTAAAAESPPPTVLSPAPQTPPAPAQATMSRATEAPPPATPPLQPITLAGLVADLPAQGKADPEPEAMANPAPAAILIPARSPDTPSPGAEIAAADGLDQTGAKAEPGNDTLAQAEPAEPPARPTIRQPGNGKAGFDDAEGAPKPGLTLGGSGTGKAELPQIGVEQPPEAEPAADPADLPPIERFAMPFDNPDGKPLFAVILIDDGTMDPSLLADAPFAFSVALDPTWSGAAQAMATWRAAGREVLALATALPEGATASDVAVTLQSHATSLPEAVGVMDLPKAGFQDDRELAQMAVDALAGEGLGLVTFERGLNPAAQVAARAGVRQAVVFRELDGEAEEAPKIRRYLDRAAFKAAQMGSVVVVGQMRPETVKALVEWAAEGRAGTVSLAPISAVMVLQ